MKKSIIYQISSLNDFQTILSQNEYTLVKFGAKWCRPCQGIEPIVRSRIDTLPDTIQLCWLDVDVSFALFSYFKSKRLVNGIPSLLLFHRQNNIPVDVVIGGDIQQVNLFFQRCSAL